MFAVLCDSAGKPTLGTDGKIWVDGRFGKYRVRQVVWEYRERFRDNFPGKYAEWTTYGIVPSLRNDPTTVYSIG